MADLDHFKKLNDTFGHAAGDRALRVFARLTHEMLSDDGLVCRFGGEEFVFLLPGQADAARARLDALRAALPAAIERAQAPSYTASFGVVAARLGDEMPALIRVADQALYDAKEGGRDRVQVAGPVLAIA